MLDITTSHIEHRYINFLLLSNDKFQPAKYKDLVKVLFLHFLPPPSNLLHGLSASSIHPYHLRSLPCNKHWFN